MRGRQAASRKGGCKKTVASCVSHKPWQLESIYKPDDVLMGENQTAWR